MSYDQTQIQDTEEQRKAQELSLQRWRPPIDVPGYEPRRFLGAGAYGEVWVAIDRNTGRQVAIKFYAHRGGLDWSILSREVEKLAFLSADRYVVQLLDVGWDSTPPYYVMEYVEQGSLEDRLRSGGPLGVEQAVALFRDVAVGLVHAHDKGVLHCDLKPANILLDHEGRPRIADFGQSRLSHEQQPALGTLFYMAPEQADLKAVPDAQWDVYALGALFYSMVTGAPPHRYEKSSTKTISELEQAHDLEERLDRYRRLIMDSPAPAEHRRVPGMDRGLAEIIDRCLAADPKRRFANVQSVLHALDERARRRARRPLVALGALGPAALLAIVALMAGRWLSLSLDQSERALSDRAVESLGFAADSVAAVAANELEKRFAAVEELANDAALIKLMEEVAGEDEIQRVLAALSDPTVDVEVERPSELRRIRRPLEPPRDPEPDDRPEPSAEVTDARFPEVTELENRLRQLAQSMQVPRKSWFITSANGVQLVREPASTTTGKNFSWRTYFHGGVADYAESWRPAPDQHIQRTHLSAAYKSQSTEDWSVAVSAPVFGGASQREFLGVVALSFEVGRAFFDLKEAENRFAVLADMRPGGHQGLLVQHPLYFEVPLNERDRLQQYRLSPDDAHPEVKETKYYQDPMGGDAAGRRFDQRWLAAQRPVIVRGNETGWVVIVQEAYDETIGGSLDELRSSFVSTGLIALASIAVVIGLLWAFVVRSLSIMRPRTAHYRNGAPTPTPPRGDSM
ncbi:MAG: protein kinase [Pirellulales bacterium]